MLLWINLSSLKLLISFLFSLQLDKALEMQQKLLQGSKQQAPPSSLSGRLIRDAHTFAETFMANVSEETARTYSLEVIKLATGLVDYGNKQIPYKPRVVSYPPMEPPPAHSLSFSPIIHHAAQRPHQRTSWGGQTPSYGRPQATPVAGSGGDEVSLLFQRFAIWWEFAVTPP